KNNEWVWLRCRGHVEYDDEGEPAIFAGFISNLGKKNYRDILTSLYNKFEFEKRISEMQGEFTIMLLNIDDFKSINSLYNREFGDNILRIIGQNLQTLFSKDATVFKLDGDEFGLIFKKLDDIQIKAIFQKILFYANQPHSYEDKPYTFTVTAGSASSPIDGTTYLKLQRNCEIALQYGKHNRRGKLTIFNEEIFTEKTFHLQLLNILKQDMKNDFRNFSLVYQPIIDANHRQIMKVEALCRWKHQNFSNIGPGYFIPLLEDTGDIVKLGKWIFKKAIEQIRDWLIFNPDISVSINVSYIQLIEEDFVSFVKKVIEEYDIPFDHVVIELTETAIAKNATLIIETIRSLRELGIQIAMDDFGTGYSSLSLLKDEPLDIIKIDQSFVRGIENDSFNQAFIKLIIELCHQIGLSVLIEGVETKKELDLILPLNPDFIQGYYTGMPMPTHELVHLIKKEKTS
ncbi:MAG: bifunctional diguanylate cyclase/phosphodiesterase, partial [Coprobacillus sp.]